jgi:hypothetical protein
MDREEDDVREIGTDRRLVKVGLTVTSILSGSEVVTVLGVCCHLGQLPVLLSDNSQSTPDW